ncbi:Copper amine oxidase-like N-terminal domain-containing protein, partial [Dysosmobacter welbionis]
AAHAAGDAELTAPPGDHDADKVPVPLADGFGHRGPLGADGGTEGGVLDVAAGEHRTVAALQGGAHGEVGIGDVGPVQHGDGRGLQFFTGHGNTLLCKMRSTDGRKRHPAHRQSIQVGVRAGGGRDIILDDHPAAQGGGIINVPEQAGQAAARLSPGVQNVLAAKTGQGLSGFIIRHALDLSQGGNLLFCFPGAAGRQPGHQKDGQQKQIDTPFHGGSPPLRPVDLPLGTNRYIHDILCVVKLQVPVSGMAQGGAVRVEPVADDGAEILLDIAEALNAHGGKDSEALALEVLEHRAGVLPVVAVGPLPVRVKQDGSGTHQAAHLVK